MRKSCRFHFVLLGLIPGLLLVAACSPVRVATPTATLPPLETRLPTATPTSTPLLSPPMSPQSASTPTPTLPLAEVLGIAPSPPSTATVLLAREDGALVLHSLADGQQRVLLDPGLYDVSGDAFLIPLLWPVRLSPNGQWLLVPTPNDGTWLVSLDGKTQRQVNPERLTATWAPDSHRIAFRGEIGPERHEQDKEIYIQDIVREGQTRLLARLPQCASYPTWSPDCGGSSGSQVTAFSCETGEVYACTVWLIDTESGQVHALGQFAPQPMMGTPRMIRWSPHCDEVRVSASFGARAFPVDGSGPRPLASAYQPDPRTVSPSGTLRAWAQQIPGENRWRLIVARTDSDASVTYDTAFEQVEGGVRWTSDGWRVLINSYTGEEWTLWMVDPAVGQPELVAEKINFLGTLDELRHSSTEIGAPQATLRPLPRPGHPSTWIAHDLPGLGVRLRVPAEWHFEVWGSGITQTVTLASFEKDSGSASLGNDQIEITFDYLPRPPADDFTAWLSQTIEMELNQVTVEAIRLAGCLAARVRAIVSPVGEEVRVPLDEGELRITHRPISSTYDTVFEQVIGSLELIMPEQPEACHTYTDTALGFAIDYPAGWEADGVQGGFVLLWNPAMSGEERQAINIAALAEPSLEAMLDNVERGSFGPYVISAEPAQLGGLEALKVTLRQAPEAPSLLWLVITPQSRWEGQGLTIAAYGDPGLAEVIVATWRLVP
jgi:hypothetical protein